MQGIKPRNKCGIKNSELNAGKITVFFELENSCIFAKPEPVKPALVKLLSAKLPSVPAKLWYL